MDEYDAAAARWASSMRAAQPFIRQRQEAQRAVMIANRAASRSRPCGIKGCKRSGGKRGLCADHWKLVSWESKWEMIIACWTAQIDTAAKYHRRFVREVRATLAA